MNGNDLKSRALAVALALGGSGLAAQLLFPILEAIQRDNFNNAVLVSSSLIGMFVIFLVPWGLIRIVRVRGWFSIPHPENAIGGLALAACLVQGVPEFMRVGLHHSVEGSQMALGLNLVGGIAGALLALRLFKRDRSLVLIVVAVVALIPSQILLQAIARRLG